MKTPSLCAVFFLLGGGVSFAEECPTHNQLVIKDDPFDLVYGSWVEPKQGAFVYGRCVGAKNHQEANISWNKAQLFGVSKIELPQYVTFSFLTDSTLEVDSELRYGVEEEPERWKTVNILIHEKEGREEANLQQIILDRKKQYLQGEKLEEGILTARSDARITFFDEKRVTKFFLTIRFESRLDVSDFYEYSLEYKISSSASSPEDFKLTFSPRDKYLAEAMSKAEVTQVRAGEFSQSFKLPVEEADPISRRTTQVVTPIVVRQNNETALAAFPVSLFRPAEE